MAKALAEAGADVAIMYVSSDKTHDTAANVAKEFGVVCKAYKADMCDTEQVTAALEQIFQDFGQVDVFVANAGILLGGNAEVSRGAITYSIA
jgi:NAD(P)-dependent dehydrogenase (short-subunit alcohol dehydrogenase family)